MKSAKEYWLERFDEYPQSDADKLAVAMMQEYSIYVRAEELREIIKQPIENHDKNHVA